MPRVNVRTKNRAGEDRFCGRCERKIEPGETYRSWSFRYGGTHFRCHRPECAPRQSELTQSRMGDVYAAIEDAQASLPGADGHEEIQDLVQGVADVVQEVADEYREADEAFGGHGATENAERADELEGWSGDLEAFYPEDEDDLEDVRSEAEDLLGGCPL